MRMTKVSIILIRTANGFANTLVLVAVLLTLAFGCYAIWDSAQIAHAASSARYERYRPCTEDESLSFAYLQAMNPDVFAWLTVYGTNIDYPVVQGYDNVKYVNTNAEGRHSLSGAIFLDYRNSPYFADFNNILYGHHMEGRVMFGEISMFGDEDYFNARRHGTLFFDGQEHGLDFFAFIHVDANDHRIFRANITGNEAQQAYLDLLMDIAVHTQNDVAVTTNDHIVMLSTCSPSSSIGRDILIGKITENIQDNPFETERDNGIIAIPINIPMIDTLPDFWTQISSGTKIAIIATIFVSILLIAILFYKKK